MGNQKTKAKSDSARKRKNQLRGQKQKLIAENGMTLQQRAAQRRYDSVVQRGDVVALTRSRDDAQKADGLAQEAADVVRAMETARTKAEGERRLRHAATIATEAEHASRLRAEEEERAAKEQLEEERRRVRVLVKKLERLGLEKKEQDKKYQVAVDTPLATQCPLNLGKVREGGDGMRFPFDVNLKRCKRAAGCIFPVWSFSRIIHQLLCHAHSLYRGR
ncbi:unnamed protein product [Ectocarpus sp. CCAP 1310/34]|nr:unnamed protein product [Ectocarpus sp. CCAP 1310/34]